MRAEFLGEHVLEVGRQADLWILGGDGHFTIVEIESAACRVSRQPMLSVADRRPEDVLFLGWGFVAQAAANTSAARVTALK